MVPRVIHIHADAPAKPNVGQACNGCGVCCVAEPCPVGMIVSRKRRGTCAALRWDEVSARYRCGLLRAGGGWWSRWARRFIAAGQGCDSDLEVAAVASGR